MEILASAVLRRSLLGHGGPTWLNLVCRKDVGHTGPMTCIGNLGRPILCSDWPGVVGCSSGIAPRVPVRQFQRKNIAGRNEAHPVSGL